MTKMRWMVGLALATSVFSGCKKDCKTPTVAGEVRVAVCQSGAGRLILDGTEFRDRTNVMLVNGDESFEATAVTVNDEGTHLEADMPAGLEPGVSYEVILENGSCTDEEPHMTVTAVSGAFLFLADPDVVYNGVNTQVTLFGSSLLDPLPADGLVVTGSAGTEGMVTDYTAVPGRANRLQILVPTGEPADTYDVSLRDSFGCSTQLDDAYRVTDSTSIDIAAVEPPFADAAVYTSIQIQRDTTSGNAFVATPRLFLNPSSATGETPAIPVQSVSFVDGDTLNAVVPPDQPAGTYDLIVVSPDGSVGVLEDAFVIQTTPPPVVATVTPSSIPALSAQSLVVAGTSLSADGSAVVTCTDPVGATATPTTTVSAAPTCDGLDCAATIEIDGSVLAAGSVCLLRWTNGDGSYFDYSAIGVTNSSLNINDPIVGASMNVARRALVGLSGRATATARFVYAIGGDGGASAAGSPFDSVEAATVNLDGALGSFRTLAESPMTTPRAFAGGVRVGRYLYVTGGFDGTSILGGGERAMILDPVEVPRVDIGDIIPNDEGGLDAGTYVYRVSAVFSDTDVDNPSGESLPSDEFVVRLPALEEGRKLDVVISVEPPRDQLGALIPNVVGYRVYRSPTSSGVSGDSVLVGMIPTGETTFHDDGTATPGTDVPLQVGSLGRFVALPGMMTPVSGADVPAPARMGHAVLAAPDPSDENIMYLYSALGRDTLATPTPTDGTTSTSYEFLRIDVAANGHQTFAATWTEGSATSLTGRWQVGAWAVDASVLAAAGANTYLYFGGGLDAAGDGANTVEVALVQAGGQLDAFADASKDFSASRAGYGTAAANGSLFVFGGVSSEGGTPIGGATAAKFTDATTLTPNSWNNEGLSMDPARYLMGTSIESAFIFFLGGQTVTGGVTPAEASETTSFVVW